jgi:hypothetical protein
LKEAPATPPSVEDQTKSETIKGNEKDYCGKPNNAQVMNIRLEGDDQRK